MEGGLAAGIMLGDPRAINAAVEDAAGTPFAPQVNALLLRAQQRAVYKSRNEGHYALGARAYCHFTSPIRRYPDLIVHRVLKLALAKRELGKKEALARAPRFTGKGPQALEAICPQLCRQASDNERAADAAANASQKVKVAQFYAGRIGERDTGTVCWILRPRCIRSPRCDGRGGADSHERPRYRVVGFRRYAPYAYGRFHGHAGRSRLPCGGGGRERERPARARGSQLIHVSGSGA